MKEITEIDILKGWGWPGACFMLILNSEVSQMFRSNSLMRRALPFLAALTAIMAGGMACAPAGGGLSGSGGSNNLKEFILEDAEYLFITNVEAFFNARELPSALLEEGEDTGDAQDRFLAEWEDDLFAFLHPDEVSSMIFVGIRGEGGKEFYIIFQGDFAPGDIIDGAEDSGFEEDTYRDFPVWLEESGDGALAVFEEEDFFVVGEDDVVRDFLKALDRGEGFATGEHGLRRVLDAAGDGLNSEAEASCRAKAYVSQDGRHDYTWGQRLSGWAAETSGCEALALTVTGGDEDTTLVTMAVLFRSERRAESGLEDLEERMEDSAELDIDVEDARVRAELAVMELVIHE